RGRRGWFVPQEEQGDDEERRECEEKPPQSYRFAGRPSDGRQMNADAGELLDCDAPPFRGDPATGAHRDGGRTGSLRLFRSLPRVRTRGVVRARRLRG